MQWTVDGGKCRVDVLGDEKDDPARGTKNPPLQISLPLPFEGIQGESCEVIVIDEVQAKFRSRASTTDKALGKVQRSQ